MSPRHEEDEAYIGPDRRNNQDWLYYRRQVIKDIEGTKEDINDIKKDIVNIRLLVVEMKTELKGIISRSSAITSTIVSTIITIIGVVVAYFLPAK